MNIAPRPPAAGIPCHKPSRAEEKYIRDGLAFLTMTSPFFSHILYSEMDIRYTSHVPWAATDAHTIFVNPQGMLESKWGLEEVAFVLAHEACHYIFGDLISAITWRETKQVMTMGGALPYVHEIMNRAMDLRINPALIEGRIGKMPKEGLFDPSISAKGMEGCVEIYEKIFPHGAGGASGFDIHIDPGKAAEREEQGVGKARRVQAIAAAVQAAQAAGKGDLPAAFKVMIGELLDPKVAWQDHLRASMQRAAGEPRHDWAKLNKRLISRPDHKIVFARRGSYGCGTVVVGYDTSGSCVNEKTQQTFFSEMAGIVADLNPAELIVIWCDAKVQRVDTLEEPTDLEELRADINKAGGAPGGGGTSFRPVFEHIKEHHIEPDMVVYLTDTYGSFPDDEPSYPTIWASIVSNPRVPFGTVVEVEL